MSAAGNVRGQLSGCRPTFLGIGAQRCGTTWLDAELRKHPECWLPPIKELHYFDRATHYASPGELGITHPLARISHTPGTAVQRMGACLGRALQSAGRGDLTSGAWWLRWGFGTYDDNWYRKLFLPGIDHPCRGEITPSYSLLSDDDVANLKRLYPDLKLLLMVRNPKDRAWSALRYWAASGGPDLREQTVRDTLARPGFLERGDYPQILDTFLRHFPPSQILIGYYDAILIDPRELLDGIAAFLGVAPFPPESIGDSPVHAAPAQDISPAIDDILNEIFEPQMAEIKARLGSYAQAWDLRKDTSDNEGYLADCPATTHPLSALAR